MWKRSGLSEHKIAQNIFSSSTNCAQNEFVPPWSLMYDRYPYMLLSFHGWLIKYFFHEAAISQNISFGGHRAVSRWTKYMDAEEEDVDGFHPRHRIAKLAVRV